MIHANRVSEVKSNHAILVLDSHRVQTVRSPTLICNCLELPTRIFQRGPRVEPSATALLCLVPVPCFLFSASLKPDSRCRIPRGANRVYDTLPNLAHPRNLERQKKVTVTRVKHLQVPEIFSLFTRLPCIVYILSLTHGTDSNPHLLRGLRTSLCPLPNPTGCGRRPLRPFDHGLQCNHSNRRGRLPLRLRHLTLLIARSRLFPPDTRCRQPRRWKLPRDRQNRRQTELSPA